MCPSSDMHADAQLPSEVDNPIPPYQGGNVSILSRLHSFIKLTYN